MCHKSKDGDPETQLTIETQEILHSRFEDGFVVGAKEVMSMLKGWFKLAYTEGVKAGSKEMNDSDDFYSFVFAEGAKKAERDVLQAALSAGKSMGMKRGEATGYRKGWVDGLDEGFRLGTLGVRGTKTEKEALEMKEAKLKRKKKAQQSEKANSKKGKTCLPDSTKDESPPSEYPEWYLDMSDKDRLAYSRIAMEMNINLDQKQLAAYELSNWHRLGSKSGLTAEDYIVFRDIAEVGRCLPIETLNLALELKKKREEAQAVMADQSRWRLSEHKKWLSTFKLVRAHEEERHRLELEKLCAQIDIS